MTGDGLGVRGEVGWVNPNVTEAVDKNRNT